MKKKTQILSRKSLRFWALILLITFTFIAVNNYVSVNNVRALYIPAQ